MQAGNVIRGMSFFDAKTDMWLFVDSIELAGIDRVTFGTPVGPRTFQFSDVLEIG